MLELEAHNYYNRLSKVEKISKLESESMVLFGFGKKLKIPSAKEALDGQSLCQ